MMLKKLHGCEEADSLAIKVHEDGRERFWFPGRPDPNGLRCYCVVFNDMSFNEIIAMTPKQAMMLEFAHGADIEISDWTEEFNLQPHMLEEHDTVYGSFATKHKYEDVLAYKKSI